MDSAIAYEESLVPELTLPEQFQSIWHGPALTNVPERMLAMSVLWQAIGDLRKFRYARRRKRQRLYMEAYNWVASNDRSWPYSFVNICDALGLSPAALRAAVLRHPKIESEEAA